MKQSARTSIAFSDTELAILDATAQRLGMSRSLVLRHLTIYQALCGGDLQLSRRIYALPPANRRLLLAEIRTLAETEAASRPPKLHEWLREAIRSDDPSTAADVLLQRLTRSKQ